MTLSADVILERMKLKDRVRLWRLIAIIAIIAVAIVLLGGGNSKMFGVSSIPSGDFIASIEVKDIIINDKERIKIINDIIDSDNIKAVILNIDSPGGTAVGGEILYEKILELKKKKPVVSVMGGMATSAGYMIALPSDRIFSRKATITGSIGVILQAPDLTNLAEKIGVKINTIKTGPLKGSPSPFEKLTTESESVMQKVVDSFYDVFIDIVARHRKLSVEDVKKLADGRVFTGIQAVDNKLVDEIGGEEKARKWLVVNKRVKDSLEIIEIPLHEDKSKLDELLSSVAGKTNIITDIFSSKGLLSIW